jgi:hypothetical protein
LGVSSRALRLAVRMGRSGTGPLALCNRCDKSPSSAEPHCRGLRLRASGSLEFSPARRISLGQVWRSQPGEVLGKSYSTELRIDPRSLMSSLVDEASGVIAWADFQQRWIRAALGLGQNHSYSTGAETSLQVLGPACDAFARQPGLSKQVVIDTVISSHHYGLGNNTLSSSNRALRVLQQCLAICGFRESVFGHNGTTITVQCAGLRVLTR